jgi:RNA polymerase sigma factor (sigma-70 family)
MKINKKKANTVFPYHLDSYVRDFQKTGSTECFQNILVSIELLIVRMIHQERRKSSMLSRLDFKDLYQIGVVSLYEALAKFRIELSSIYSLPRYLQGYLKKNLWKFATDENKYVCCGTDIGTFEKHDNCYQTGEKQKEYKYRGWMVKDALQKLKESGKIGPEDEKMFNMRHYDGLRYKTIAEKAGRGEYCVKKRISRLRDKIKVLLEELSQGD